MSMETPRAEGQAQLPSGTTIVWRELGDIRGKRLINLFRVIAKIEADPMGIFQVLPDLALQIVGIDNTYKGEAGILSYLDKDIPPEDFTSAMEALTTRIRLVSERMDKKKQMGTTRY